MPLQSIVRQEGFPFPTFYEVYPSKYIMGVCKEIPSKVEMRGNQNWIITDLKGFHNDNDRPENEFMYYAIALTAKRFELPMETPILHLIDVFKHESDIWTKNPGLPWSRLGVKMKSEIRDNPESIQAVRKFWHSVKDKEDVSFPDCCAFVRGHICDSETTKVQAIWGYPATITFGEAMFAIPLIEAYQKLDIMNTPLAYGYNNAEGIEKIRERMMHNDHFYCAFVFSKFEKTMPAWLIDLAFDVFLLNIDIAHYRGYGVPDTRKILHMYDEIKNYFINTPIRMANGMRFKKNSGIANGSYFTQLIGSVCITILITYALLRTTLRPPSDVLFLGYESIFSTISPVSIDEMAKVLAPLGVEINIENSQISTNINDLKIFRNFINDELPEKDANDL